MKACGKHCLASAKCGNSFARANWHNINVEDSDHVFAQLRNPHTRLCSGYFDMFISLRATGMFQSGGHPLDFKAREDMFRSGWAAHSKAWPTDVVTDPDFDFIHCSFRRFFHEVIQPYPPIFRDRKAGHPDGHTQAQVYGFWRNMDIVKDVVFLENVVEGYYEQAKIIGVKDFQVRDDFGKIQRKTPRKEMPEVGPDTPASYFWIHGHAPKPYWQMYDRELFEEVLEYYEYDFWFINEWRVEKGLEPYGVWGQDIGV